MSSETSTRRRAAALLAVDDAVPGFQPWHLFLILSLLASSAGAIAVRGTRPANVVFVCLTIMSAGVAAYALYRTLRPLVEPDSVEAPEMLGGRTRAALEREKALVLRAIKELEFDRAMGKVSEPDWHEMTARLRSRAVRLIRQLDSGSAAYRELIEKELAARLAIGGSRPGSDKAGRVLVALVAVGSALAAWPASAQMGGAGGGAAAGMPDAKAMSGIARPSETEPTGTVSVRLVRGQLSNVVVGHPVEFLVDGKRRTVTTDGTGHGVLSGLAPGAIVQAVATVDAERIESQQFQMPPQGGVVLMLTAADRAAAVAMARAAVDGTVVLGGQSRVVTQFEDETVQVFFLVDIVNAGQAPVKTAPLVFEMPRGAQSTTVMEGSSPGAVARGPQVTVAGPFPPGNTTVQMAYSLPPAHTVAIRQNLPAALSQVTVVAEKVGPVVIASSQLTNLRETSESGRTFLLGAGPALRSGDVLAFDLTGMPHHPTWPRRVAIALGALVLAAGVWGAVRTGGRSPAASARHDLEARRERLFGELIALDRAQNASGADVAAMAGRRRDLVAELENVYGELDTEATGPRGDRGLSA